VRARVLLSLVYDTLSCLTLDSLSSSSKICQLVKRSEVSP